ncbi:MAG: hypothetical protein BWY31_02283 [Lentisphaerae bacterium ADurb.Bin242]|nr:MAG: hypothetical protein BWY31_02283 [Lentisphaerae bacterium ADurb.Bin242]
MNRKSFTMVELLVVIAVITILAGMLLPALAKARSTAIRIKCIGNLKQLGLVFNHYADVYNEWLPARWVSENYSGNHHGTYGYSWIDLLSYSGLVKYENFSVRINPKNILSCPAASKGTGSTNFGLNTTLRIQYMNASAQSRGVWKGADDFLKRHTVRNPSSVAMIGDCNETTYQIDASQAQDDIYPLAANFSRHDSSLNMLFIDAHVENMRKNKVLYWATTAIRFSKPWFY